jgi:beta-lactamase class A
MADVRKVAARRLAGDRPATCAWAIAMLLLISGCGSPDAPASVEAGPTRERPPTNVTIEPIAGTSVPADVVRPGTPGALDGEVTDATPEPGLCPEAFPEDHELHGTGTLRLPQAEEVDPPERLEYDEIETDGALEELIRERLGDDEGRYAVVIKDLSSGRGVEINGGRLFYAASLFKLSVMFETFHQREAGLIDFNERYIASDYYAGFGLGPHLIEQCDEVTIQQALTAMMSVSDNTAAVMLQDRAGPRHVNASMSALGLEVTALLSDALPLNAADMALLLEAIARGDAVSEEASLQMAELLVSEKIDDRIPSGVPDGTVVAHKTGNWENATHDAGIVYGARSTYVVVLLSDIGFDGDAASVQREVTRIAWEWFEGSPAE